MNASVNIQTNYLSRSFFRFFAVFNFNLSLLLAMSLHRLVLFLLVVKHWLFGAESSDIVWSFITGIRFDLCVLGFMNIPVLAAVWVFSIDTIATSKNPLLIGLRRWLVPVYLGIGSFLICLLAVLDLLFFANDTRRLTMFDVQEKGWGFVTDTLSRWGFVFSAGVIGLYFLLWAFRSIYIIYQSKMTHEVVPQQLPAWQLWAGGVVLPFLVVVLAARGTWTPHHLALEHAQVSQIPALNQLALSPVWAFDKKF